MKRPTGVVLIALYYLLNALLLLLQALSSVMGGSIIGNLFGNLNQRPFSGAGVGLLLALVGGAFFLFYALLAAAAAYGIWSMREWGRILSLGLAALSLVSSLPGLILIHVFGIYQLSLIGISILIIWYLLQRNVRALFQRPASPTPSP